jgi:endo-1,4-beta-xylanase
MMRKLLWVLWISAVLAFAGCPQPNDDTKTTFIPVSNIGNIPATMMAGAPLTLSGTVEPENADRTAIVWNLHNAGTTGATISEGNILNAATPGTVTVRATIAGGKADGTAYTQDFAITVLFKAVTGINGVPEAMTAGIPLILSGTVEPEDAGNVTIVWSIGNAGTTGASISEDNILNAAAGGTVTVRATIAGGKADGTAYTQDFDINVTIKAVTDISGIPAAMVAGTPLILSGTVEPEDATNKTIVWSVFNAGTTGAVISEGNILNASAGGQVTVRATVVNGLSTGDYFKDFTIAASVPPGPLAISVGFNRGIEITGSNGVNVIRKFASGSLILSVESAAGYTDVAWYMDGGATAVASGDTLAINAADYAVQIHSVTCMGKKDGAPYSKVIPFTVLD